jgi:hypothetical protein
MSRLLFAVESASLLFFGSLLAAILTWGFRGLIADGFRAVVLLGMPALASILFIAAAAVVPALVRPKRRGFPLCVTLPLVFLSLKVVAVVLSTTGGVGILSVPEPLQPAFEWLAIRPLLSAALLQGLLLSTPLLPSGEERE